jgi:hypothetical protein
MGTTFVTITEGTSGDEPGFWMRDAMLELWLRLLSLHLPEPDDYGEHLATPEIRNRWLLASRGYFIGCVPHEMEYACSTSEGSSVVRHAIESLMTALDGDDAPLDAGTINLLGIEGTQLEPIARERLKDIGWAFLDLINGRITCTASSTDIMPGSKPYPPKTA